MKKCEVVLAWEYVRGFDRPRIGERCNRAAVASYPAMGGGRMHLCAMHVEPHMRTPAAAEAIDLRDARTGEPYGWTKQSTPA